MFITVAVMVCHCWEEWGVFVTAERDGVCSSLLGGLGTAGWVGYMYCWVRLGACLSLLGGMRCGV